LVFFKRVGTSHSGWYLHHDDMKLNLPLAKNGAHAVSLKTLAKNIAAFSSYPARIYYLISTYKSSYSHPKYPNTHLLADLTLILLFSEMFENFQFESIN
jgi:hypothetical protein